MIIPKIIDIIGHDIEVFVDDLVLDGEFNQNMGLAYFNQEKIQIAKNCHGVEISEDNIGETFLHEIIHLVSGKMGIKLSERQVTGLGTGLYQVLKTNKLQFF